jgi:hypothetical protein
MASCNPEEGERAYDTPSSLVPWPALTTGQDVGWIQIVARHVAQSGQTPLEIIILTLQDRRDFP